MRGIYVTCIAVGLCVSSQAQNTAEDLLQLIRNDDLSTLKTRLTNGAHVDTADSRGTTLLLHAAAIGSPEAVKLLLDSGANVKAKNQVDETALLLGAGDFRKVRALVEAGADVNAASKLGRTPLIAAAFCDGCSAIVKYLLDHGADPKAKDARGITALNNAADANDLDSMKFLIAKGAEPDHHDSGDFTPLLSAANNCNLPAIKMLLAKGADVNTANTSAGEVKFGKIQLMKLTPLMLASTYCSAEIVKTLLDAKADVNARDVREMTPLMFAVSSDAQNTAVVKLLIKSGADVTARSKVGENSLDWAKKFNYPEIVFALTAAGARESMPFTPPDRKLAAERPVTVAVERAAAILQKSSTEFFTQSGCVGCHHQLTSTVALAAARGAGVHVDEAAEKSYVQMVESELKRRQQTMLERLDSGGLADGPTWQLLALGAQRYPSSSLTDIAVAYISSFQRRDGSWWTGGVARTPMEDGAMARTALAVRAIQSFSTLALKIDVDRRIALAAGYLQHAKPVTTDDMAMQIAGLHWAGAGDKTRPLAKALISAQRSDGGWGQNPNLPSDAFATGESLYALLESGALKPGDSASKKAVRFLLANQCDDGSWYVRSRAPKFQPYFQSGFPFDHDQWISSAATSWAVRALSPAAENEKRTSR